MKGKQLAILLVLGVVLGGAWFIFSKRNQSSWSETAGGGGKVVEFPINDVAHITIKGSDGEVNLVKKAGAWTVRERGDYPANFESIGSLLRKLWDLKTVQVVKVGPSQLPRLELDEKAATKVEFKDKEDKPLGGLLLGKKHLRKSDGGGDMFGGAGGFPAGRYVKPLAREKVSLVSETLDEVQPKPENWLAKDFIKIDAPKSISVAGEHTWSLTRESAAADWQLADAKPDEKIDAGKTAALKSVFASPTFSDVLALDAKLEEPITNAAIETFDGFRYELKIGKPTGENHPVLVNVSANFPKERTPGKDEKPEDKTRLDGEFAVKQKGLEEKLDKEKKMEGRPYLVAKYVVDPLLKDRAALLADKPAEPANPADTEPHAPVSVTTPPVTAPAPAPKIEAVTPPVTVPKIQTVTPPVTAPPPKIEAVTPPVAAPLPPAAPSVPKPAPVPPAPQNPEGKPAPDSAEPADAL